MSPVVEVGLGLLAVVALVLMIVLPRINPRD